MSYKIGVYGSSVNEGPEAETPGKALGRALAKHGCIVITGGCGGMPYVVAHEAAKHGCEVWGFTPAVNAEEHRRAYPYDDSSIYARLIYVPENYHELFLKQPPSEALDWSERLKYRNVISTINSDAGIVISGSWGTLNEFTNLIYEGKPIGVLTGTGGLADQLPGWFPRLRKKSDSVVIFESEPEKLVERVLATLEKENS